MARSSYENKGRRDSSLIFISWRHCVRVRARACALQWQRQSDLPDSINQMFLHALGGRKMKIWLECVPRTELEKWLYFPLQDLFSSNRSSRTQKHTKKPFFGHGPDKELTCTGCAEPCVGSSDTDDALGVTVNKLGITLFIIICLTAIII